MDGRTPFQSDEQSNQDDVQAARQQYRETFKTRVIALLRHTEGALRLPTQPTEVASETSNSPSQFETFTAFANAFLGQEEVNNSLTTDPAILDGLTILDHCVKEEPDLFSNLVQSANLLRADIQPDDPFAYSEAALEPNQEKAKKIGEKFCSNLKKLDVLNAQLSHIIWLILGDNFNYAIPNALKNRFPEGRVWKQTFSKSEGEDTYYSLKNVLTNEERTLSCREYSEEIKHRNSEFHDPIHPVIPHKPPRSMLDYYTEYYGESNCAALEEKINQKDRGYRDIPPSILRIIQKTWCRLKRLTQENSIAEQTPTISDVDQVQKTGTNPALLSNTAKEKGNQLNNNKTDETDEDEENQKRNPELPKEEEGEDKNETPNNSEKVPSLALKTKPHDLGLFQRMIIGISVIGPSIVGGAVAGFFAGSFVPGIGNIAGAILGGCAGLLVGGCTFALIEEKTTNTQHQKDTDANRIRNSMTPASGTYGHLTESGVHGNYTGIRSAHDAQTETNQRTTLGALKRENSSRFQEQINTNSTTISNKKN